MLLSMSRLLKLAFLLVLMFCMQQAMPQAANRIVPAPVSFVAEQGGAFLLDEETAIYFPSNFSKQATLLQEQLYAQVGIRLPLNLLMKNAALPASAIVLEAQQKSIDRPEMYRLHISAQRVLIQANDVRGFVNAIQTLLQLLPLQKSKSVQIPALRITDYPRFAYRGMHLDVVRHFFSVDYIKKYIDYLTFHKFNTFHWHLTDDQGWRFEVKSYPLLNSIGSWRDSTLIGHFRDTPARYDGKRYGGYYTRAEIKSILDYAAVRGITVIPELDIPGHSRAAIAAYPQLSTRPDTVWNVATTWGMYNRKNNVLAPNDFTFQFLKDIFAELASLFSSSPYIHLGGDECSKMWWKQDPATQRFMQKKGLKNETALQTYFISYVADLLKQNGKKVVGWHEITEGAVDTSALIMNWSDEAKALSVAKKGYQLIMSPGKPFYFDHFQSKDPRDSLAIHGYNPLQAVYQYSVIPASLSKAGLAHKVMGAQGNVWTEYMEHDTKVDYMIFPRMTALSENLWSEKKDYQDFLKRLEATIVPRYTWWGSSYFKDYRRWTAEQ